MYVLILVDTLSSVQVSPMGFEHWKNKQFLQAIAVYRVVDSFDKEEPNMVG